MGRLQHSSVGMQINKLLQPNNNFCRSDPKSLSRGDPNGLGRGDQNCLSRGDPRSLGFENPA